MKNYIEEHILLNTLKRPVLLGLLLVSIMMNHGCAKNELYEDEVLVKNASLISTDGPAKNPIEKTQVDIMIVYTSIAKDSAGGTQAMELLLNQIVSWTNLAYANSEIPLNLNLVHSAEVDYMGQGGFVDLAPLQNPNDGILDEVHRMRDNHAADLVTLLKYPPGGAASFPVDASTGFSVISMENPTWYFAHETGHNFGGRHEQGYDFFVSPGVSVRTIMIGGGALLPNVIPNYSNPEVLYSEFNQIIGGPPIWGTPTGTEDHNNAQIISSNRELVASYR
ncbi:MAG: zinc-dependent metalloprotease family protein [Bacteroidota bacterium]